MKNVTSESKDSKIRKTVVLVFVSLMLASALAVLSPQTSSATTIINAHVPQTAFGVVFGTVDRNNECYWGLVCGDTKGLWYQHDSYFLGFRTWNQTELNVKWDGNVTPLACSWLPGWWLTAHKSWITPYDSYINAIRNRQVVPWQLDNETYSGWNYDIPGNPNCTNVWFAKNL